MPRSTRYLERKWRKFFTFLDTNSDGTITFNDLDHLSRDVNSYAGLRHTQLHQLWLRWWVLMEHITGEICLDLSLTQFMQAMKHIMINREDCERFEGLWEHMFDVLDNDRDGCLRLQELSVFYQWRGGQSEEYAKQVFRNLDINYDGMITRDEFLQAISLFWFDDDPCDDYSFMFSDRPKPKRYLRRPTDRKSLNLISTAKQFMLCCWL